MTASANTPLPSADPVGGEDRPWFKYYPEAVPSVIKTVEERSLSDMVRNAAKHHGDKTAFSNLGGKLTFNDVDRLATDFAAFLQTELGLVKGDRIVIQMPNLMQFPVAFYGALRAGLIVVNANPLYTVTELKEAVHDAQPRAIVVLSNFAFKVEELLEGSSLEHVVITDAADMLSQPKRAIINFAADKIKHMVRKYSIPNAVSFVTALKQGAAATWKDPELTPADVALLQYTGGTTGGTKAAILSHWNLLNNQEQFMGQIRDTLGEEKQPVIIAALPLYHVFALTVNAIGFYRFGAHNVLVTNPRDLKGFVKTIHKSKPDGLMLVSTLAAALMDNEDFAKDDHSGLRITVAGGMALRSSVGERWKKITGKDITEGYGLTEASPVVAVNPTHMPPRIGTIGIPLPSTDVRIVDEDHQDVELGAPGELAVLGPQVMSGYWNNPEESANVLFDGGWLLTGDIATMDEDGFLRIVDRKKEIIVVSGFNVFPGELEDAAMLNPKVSEAGATGVPDEHAGEVPKLYVVKRDDSLTADELRKFLKKRLAGYKRPHQIVFVAELPKTNVGKVLRRALKDLDAEAAAE
ncbi:AMP-binding protein [Demequina oxidasica]|uniref:AMP-binding protein n=1 Tax=Demequina oxidasica TaxID=676199 RepID=UPI0007813162|nr:AMP-binding protein [Demequina oxidasica]